MIAFAVVCPWVVGAFLGAATSNEPASARYVLPYPAGTAFELLQGYGGPWGHQGAAEYAYDFRMAIGSEVVAVRAGIVVKVEASFANSTRKPGEENHVFVDHGDGTFARYYHLDQNGVLVAAGAAVAAGQPIAKSGDSGASAGPHLHFDVTKDCPEWGCQTVPIAFVGVPENPLVQGREYAARQ